MGDGYLFAFKNFTPRIFGLEGDPLLVVWGFSDEPLFINEGPLGKKRFYRWGKTGVAPRQKTWREINRGGA